MINFYKLNGYILLQSIAILLSIMAVIAPQKEDILTLHISNIKNIEGQIQVGIFNNKADFPKPGKEFLKVMIPVTSSSITEEITRIPIGEYAIAIYHDENADGKCNKNFFGIPKEAYGFSNNVIPIFSAPSFRSAKFNTGESAEIHIKLR